MSLVERGDILARHLLPGSAFLGGALDDFIVDVGEVACVQDVVAQVFQVPENRVEHHRRPSVADMAIVVNRDPADVDAHVIVPEGDEVFLFSGQGIE
jgi:hypothetical protein